MKLKKIPIVAGLWLAVLTAGAVSISGPTNGTLVVVGGGLKDSAILKRFIELAGGPAAPIVLIPTANEKDQFGADWTYYKLLHDLGATNLIILHTRDRKSIVQKHPDLLGIGLDEDTAIVVHGDDFEVLGASKVAIYDAKRVASTKEAPYFFLQSGDHYNLLTRQKETSLSNHP